VFDNYKGQQKRKHQFHSEIKESKKKRKNERRKKEKQIGEGTK
jgi:hypothetical protein